MSGISTSAIMLRRIEFGDYDLILTFFSYDKGKISLIAKSAKKSKKRFAGILELFSVLQVVYSHGRRKGLPVLQEATLLKPFSSIRLDIRKTAYASYWAELIKEWMEEGQKNTELYLLLLHVLEELDHGNIPVDELSILFQMRFMLLSGHSPNFMKCSTCMLEIDRIKETSVFFDLSMGGIVCDNCASMLSRKLSLSKGTVKQLRWTETGDLSRAKRVRFTSRAVKEGLELLEAFVPYHLGKEPKSLKFLKQIR